MRAKPAIYEAFLQSLADAIASEMKRRGLSHIDVGQRLRWSTTRTNDLKHFAAGDALALGPESALRVAGVLGLSVTQVRPAVAPQPRSRVAA